MFMITNQNFDLMQKLLNEALLIMKNPCATIFEILQIKKMSDFILKEVWSYVLKFK